MRLSFLARAIACVAARRLCCPAHHETLLRREIAPAVDSWIAARKLPLDVRRDGNVAIAFGNKWCDDLREGYEDGYGNHDLLTGPLRACSRAALFLEGLAARREIPPHFRRDLAIGHFVDRFQFSNRSTAFLTFDPFP